MGHDGNDSEKGTLHAAGERMMLRFERRFAHPPEKVWRLLTTPEGLARWFPARVEFDALEVGSAMRFVFTQEDVDHAKDAGVDDVPLASGGVILEVDPPRVFAFDWLGEPIRFELEPDGAGCRLVFTHVFDRDEAQAPRNAGGWHVCLDGLDAALAGASAPSKELANELQRIYATELREQR